MEIVNLDSQGLPKKRKKSNIQNLSFEVDLQSSESGILDSVNSESLQNFQNLNSENQVSLRPSAWSEYIGQDDIKKNLKVFINAAKKRAECLDHILFFGPPGLGKTAISHIVAREMNANIKVTAAPMIAKSGDLAAILTNLQENDILFIDEIHRLSPAVEEILYPAMEDFRLDIIVGSGPAANTIKIDLPRFTLIGATTRAGMLSNPLRDRFGMSFRLNFYEPAHLQEILNRACEKLSVQILDNASFEIAKRSRGTPRIALNLLKRVRDFALNENSETITLEIAKFALQEMGINDLGFDELDLKYLNILAAAQGKAMGLSALAAGLSEDKGTIEDVIEPYLFANGYIERTERGRIATRKAYEFLKFPAVQSLF